MADAVSIAFLDLWSGDVAEASLELSPFISPMDCVDLCDGLVIPPRRARSDVDRIWSLAVEAIRAESPRSLDLNWAGLPHFTVNHERIWAFGTS